MKIVKHLKDEVKKASVYSKDKSNKHGEVFTPPKLIREMLSTLPEEAFTDPNKTFLDPCTGKGNFVVYLVQGLMIGLKDQIEKESERYKHIIENQIFMCEYQKESAIFVNDLFGLGGRFNVNLYVGDTLKMPDDFFDLSYSERKIKYPENCI
jgi:type I restriction-modification system DNA methylase subunit